MRKSIFLVATLLAAATMLVGCGGNNNNKKNFEVALITDSGDIDDGSFNQGTYEGIKQYCEANNVTYGYYRPTSENSAAHKDAINNAIQRGAKVVITPGFSFAQTINDLQNDSKYDKIQFLLIDSVTQDEKNNNTEIKKNVHCLSYMEEQAGYLAGYAAVKDGLTKLGFLGGQSIPPVARYGYGFVQGANDAAVELNIANQVTVNYWYGGTFSPSDDVYNKMDGWYSNGTEVVFACGGKIYQSATKAADASGKKVIGVDTDQSKESPTIMTSALKGIANSVAQSLEKLYANGGVWPDTHAGQAVTLGAADDCVGLPTATESWRFSKFTVEEYNDLFEKVKTGQITVSNDVNKEPTTQITVNYEK
ncbi:MAG: BMP family ABC transporter substrate-binding protein [Lachnospiraceae bacterium]|nr:BMP family ABC transporter substrate-binding protein [Lachnospiraceae bacterium]